MKTYRLTEIFLGAAVVGLVTFALSWAVLQKKSASYDPECRLVAYFDRVDGVGVGTEVRLSGIKIGRVSKMELDKETFQAKVWLEIERISLPVDTEIEILGGLLMGPRYLSINPGSDDEMLGNDDQIQYAYGAKIVENLMEKVFLLMSRKEGSPSVEETQNKEEKEKILKKDVENPAEASEKNPKENNVSEETKEVEEKKPVDQETDEKQTQSSFNENALKAKAQAFTNSLEKSEKIKEKQPSEKENKSSNEKISRKNHGGFKTDLNPFDKNLVDIKAPDQIFRPLDSSKNGVVYNEDAQSVQKQNKKYEFQKKANGPRLIPAGANINEFSNKSLSSGGKSSISPQSVQKKVLGKKEKRGKAGKKQQGPSLIKGSKSVKK